MRVCCVPARGLGGETLAHRRSLGNICRMNKGELARLEKTRINKHMIIITVVCLS